MVTGAVGGIVAIVLRDTEKSREMKLEPLIALLIGFALGVLFCHAGIL